MTLRRAQPTWGPICGLVRLGAVNAFHFRANVVVSILGMLLQTVLLVTVWRAVYAGRSEVAGVGADQAVGYAVLAAALAHLVLPFRLSTLPERVRLGTVATDVIRPVGVVGQNLAMTLGAAAAALPGSAAALALGAALGGLQPPAGLAAVLLFVPCVLGGVAMSFVLNLTVSLVAFWTTDTRGAFYIFRTVASFSSGALVPLWFMPPVVGDVLAVLPFRLQVFAPLQVWFGEATGGAAVAVLGWQALWLVVLVGLLALVARRALRVVVVNGG